ncbi:MAG: Nif3-like dinuclear metal center hexameric protein [Phycisphaerales bacterium]|nr:Nif3-like dinuclear metal center hexameric protein [Phycisphaerales bacterium]
MSNNALHAVVDLLNALAPLSLAERWDKVGLHVVGDGRAIARVCLTIDLLPEVLEDAASLGADLIVAYHPLLFKPLERLDGSVWQSRVAIDAVRKGIAIYSPHTALDNVAGGVNDWLIGCMGEGTRAPLQQASSLDASQEYRIVVFVPGDAVDRVRDALTASGAGHIGDYSACSFAAHGGGTFLPGASTHPVIGTRGKLERVPELRLEVPCSRHALAAALAALRRAHPYEEPAFDVMRMESRPDATQGAGRMVELATPATTSTIIARVKAHLGVQSLLHCARLGQSDTLHERVAVCAGSGGSLLDAVVASGASLFLTGEMSHHETILARARGVEILLAGHTNTERGFLPVYAEQIRAASAARGLSFDVCVSTADRESLRLV